MPSDVVDLTPPEEPTLQGNSTIDIAAEDTLGPSVRRFHLAIVDGCTPFSWASSTDRCSIGSHPSNDVVIDDPAVSRFHCEIRVDRSGARLRDLESRNGTIIDGVRITGA